MSATAEDSRKTAISFVHTCKRFPGMENYAVKDVTLDVKDGDFVTILGTSGSGKTTLMKMVNQLYDITEGDIIFYGDSVKKLDPVEQRRKIGYVVQAGGLFPHMTVEQNIAVVPNILKWDQAKIDARVTELLELVNLDPEIYRKRYPRQLSGGQQQRVGIARALATEPNIMLMDEPFGAIDAITRETLQKEILKLQKKMNKTILFVTHDIHEAFMLGDKVIIMDAGHLQQYDTPDNIMLHPANPFVVKLVSANDPMERMKVVTVKAVMEPVSSPVSEENLPEDAIVLASDVKIEEALTIFMKDKGAGVYVKDGGKIAGTLTWDDVAAIAS